jgi:hypothetical protein
MHHPLAAAKRSISVVPLSRAQRLRDVARLMPKPPIAGGPVRFAAEMREFLEARCLEYRQSPWSREVRLADLRRLSATRQTRASQPPRPDKTASVRPQ